MDKSSPDARLSLEWVYGYKGHQCRNNLYYTASGNVVYFVAGVGVVYDTKNKKQVFYLEHSDDIVSLALHPDKTLVATAQIGKAPFVCVWDSCSLETVSILQGGHDRGISALAFNVEGNLLASVGMDDHHTLNVWDWRRGKILATSRGHGDKIFSICFSPASGHSPSLVTCGVKHIKFWTVCGNALSGKKGVFGKKGELQTVLCAAYSAAGDYLYSGMLNGDIYKWKDHTLLSVIRGAHSGPIYSLHYSEDGYATGSKDGTVGLWSKEFKPITRLDIAASSVGYKDLVVRSVCWSGERVLVGSKGSEVLEVTVQDQAHPLLLVGGHAEGELWGLATHPQKQMFATASDDKTIRLWDMSARAPAGCVTTPHAVRSVAFSPSGGLLAAGMRDGSFSVHDTSDLSVTHQSKRRKEVLHEMKFSPSGEFLAVGSNDNFVDVYIVEAGFKWAGQCTGSSSFITHLDWSVDSKYIQTNSGASERLFYQIPGCKRITSSEEIQSIKWATWTGVLGSEVNGIWPKYSQVNDVNATQACFEHNTVVTGDDFGLVKLFRYPCLKKSARFKKYVGHCAHVTNVRFTNDNHHVISVGGADNAIFQWRFLPTGEEVNEDEEGGVDEDVGGAGYSDAEMSDSDASDVESVDSDLEKEQEKNYERTVYREDLQKLKKKLSKQSKQTASTEEVGKGRAISAATSDAVSGKRNAVPESYLTMEFVHGYRGYDCRQNLFYTKEGHVVYHVAAVGVVYNRTSHTQSFYTSHTDDILCLGLHPSMEMAVTGQIGRDPSIHVWDVVSMETQSVLKGGHSRGVCAVSFSADGKLLASVGLDDAHCLVLWEWRRGEQLANTRGHTDKIFMLSWNPLASNQLVTVGVRHIKFWTQTGGGFTSKRGLFGKGRKLSTMLSVCYGGSASTCYSGGADGKVYHWTENRLTKTVAAHKGPVYAVHRADKGYLSGGKDGVVGLWDEDFSNCIKTYQLHSSAIEGGGVLHSDLPPIRALVLGQGKILVGTKNSEVLEVDRGGPIKLLIQGHQEGELWGLASHPKEPVVVTASDDGTVRVWSLSTHRMTGMHSVGGAARCVAYSPEGSAVAVGLKNGSFKVFDTDWKELANFHHRKEEISDIKFSPSGKYLAVASHDNFVDFYSVQGKKRVGICKGPSSYITHIDWDTRGKLLQVNTGDREVLYFEAPRGKQHFIPRETVDSLSWHSWTSVLGPCVQGVWPPYTDVTDVNAACVSSDGEVVATGDDFGFVKTFKFPSFGKHAKYRQYVGHSAHVTNVRFSRDDHYLVSTGGADTAVIVWRNHGTKSGEGADTDQPDGPASDVSAALMNEDSDTDSEEEGGYDSDVEREKLMDYSSKIYAAPARDATTSAVAQGNLKPHLHTTDTNEPKTRVSRGGISSAKVVVKEKQAKVQALALDYIFGYRGFDTRQNIFWTPDDRAVYHAAGAGVVYNPLTNNQAFYLEHSDDIISLAVCRHQKLQHVVATGQLGKSAPIHVWDTHSKQTLSILHGAHGVGTCSLDFSCSGKLLLAVGLDSRHSITIWRWTEGAKVAQVSGDHRKIFCAQFRPDSNTKFVSCGTKHVRFWNLVGAELVSKRGFLPRSTGASMQTMLSLAFAPDEVTLTGSVGGDIYLWKCHTLTRVVAQAHSGPVMAMFTCLEDGLILTGGKDRSAEGAGVKLWGVDMSRSRTFPLSGDHGELPPVVRSVSRSKGRILVGTQDNRILEVEEKTGDIKVLVEGHGEGELWGLAVHPSTNTFLTASDDKTVRLWDLKTKSTLCKTELLCSARSADISVDGQLAGIGQTNGQFLLLSTSDLSVLRKKRDRSKTLQVVRFSPDGTRVAVGSDDACVDIYSVSDLVRTGYCRGIPSQVTHLDWSHDAAYLQVNTSSYQRLVFCSSSGAQLTDKDKLDKIVWATWTCVLGCEVVGIWPKNADKADVNTVDLSQSGNVAVTGDDFGCVKLFDHFPIPEKCAANKKYFGHSAHVTRVKFTHDDSYLLSAGGDDSCIFAWKCQT